MFSVSLVGCCKKASCKVRQSKYICLDHDHIPSETTRFRALLLLYNTS
uniref:Uncharacterized protein n=1 Tax=Arundo donax TaxID=35708 RepID=A0A0A9CTA3_ARUDO